MTMVGTSLECLANQKSLDTWTQILSSIMVCIRNNLVAREAGDRSKLRMFLASEIRALREGIEGGHFKQNG